MHLYLGGAFAQFSAEQLEARQRPFILALQLLPQVTILRPKHHLTYPVELGPHRNPTLFARDRLMVKEAHVVVLDLRQATKASIGACIEIGWADAWDKPLLLVMEKDNLHQHAMATAAARWVVATPQEAITILTALAI